MEKSKTGEFSQKITFCESNLGFSGTLFLVVFFLLSLGGCASAPQNNREADAVAAANAALGSMDGGSLAGPPGAAIPAASIQPAASSQAAEINTGKGRPVWVDSPEAVYGRGAYVAAVGSGKSREQAEKSAFAALSSVYRMSLQADQRIANSYQELVANGKTTDWYEGTSVEESIRTSTAMDLVGATIRNVWTDGSLHYAVAVMENAKTAQLYAQMIRDNQRVIDNLTDLPAANRNNMEGLARFQFAITLAEANKVFANVLSVIGAPVPAEMRQSEEYRLERTAIIKAIPVLVTVEGDRENRIRSAFSTVFAGEGFRTGGNNAPYQLQGRLSFSDVQLPNQSNKFVRYVLEGDFMETATGVVLFSYNVNGREGHLSVPEAEIRALRAAEAKIKEDYAETLSSFLVRLVPDK
jgi:hypothetical protein